MKTYDLLLTAGTETRLTIDYNFFLVLADGGFSFDVALFKGSGFQPCEGVSAGFGVRLNEYRGKEFIFKSANTQTIKVFVGNDEAIYQRLSGNVTINGGTLATVSNITNVGSIATLTDITNAIKAIDHGFVYGASYKSGTEMGANAADTVFSAASNVNGAIIHSARYVSGSAGSSPTYFDAGFVAKATTPANLYDGDVILSGEVGFGTGAAGSTKQAVRVAAGKGLFYIAANSEAGSSRSVLYTLL